MADTPADPLLEALVSDFGANYVFAVDLLEQYRHDRSSVEPSWGGYFDRLLGVETPATPSAAPAQAAPPDGGTRTTTLVRSQPGAVARASSAGSKSSKAMIVPAILPGDIANPIRCGAMRIVENTEASLTVPTATSMRNG